jgi:tRNA-dependent cyclodipeptide synthase
LAISVGKEQFEGDNLDAAIEWIASTSWPCVVRVSDTLQRHNLMLKGMGVREAYKKANENGLDWLKRNRGRFSRISNSLTFVRWDELMNDPSFEEVHLAFQKVVQTNPELKNSLREDIESYCNRRPEQSFEEKSLLASYCKNFILEEMAGHTILARRQEFTNLYPSKGFKSLNLLSNGIEGMPQGLEKVVRVRYTIEKAPDVNTSQGYGRSYSMDSVRRLA